MPNNNKISIIFTGLIREPDLFKTSLDELITIEKVEEIILSTWESDVSAHSKLLTNLQEKYALKVIAIPATQEWPGNLLAQMTSLYVGLGRANRQNYILKTRPDVHINKVALNHVFAKNLSITKPQGFNKINLPFSQKICVWGPEATVPFYIHDLFFFGSHRDVSKLVNMDVRYDFLYKMSQEKIHIRRFIHPLINEFPILEKFLHVEHVLGNTEKFPNNYRYYVLEKLLNNELYILILALYYKLFGMLYSSDWGVSDVFKWKNIPEDIYFESGDTLTSFFLHNRNKKALLVRGDSLFQLINEQSYEKCDIGDRFSSAIREIEKLSDIRDVGLNYDFDAFIEFVIGAGEEALEKVKKTHFPD